MKWNIFEVCLTEPSLHQCQRVISKLRNNHNIVELRNSSSYIVQFLLPQLLKIRTIIYINISSTEVTKDSIISSQLSNNTTLRELAITNGSINDDGIITLAQSLKYNKSITMLYLHSNPDITSASAQSLAELLLNNNTLEFLWLWGTNIDTNGVKVLVESLKTNKTLRKLWLNKKHKKTYHMYKDRLEFDECSRHK